MSTDAPTPETIVLIHGFWVTPRSWEHWISRLPAAPGWEDVADEALSWAADHAVGTSRA